MNEAVMDLFFTGTDIDMGAKQFYYELNPVVVNNTTGFVVTSDKCYAKLLQHSDRAWKETDRGFVTIKDRYYGVEAAPQLTEKEIFWLKLRAKKYARDTTQLA